MNETSRNTARGLRSNRPRRPLRAALLAVILSATASILASPAKNDTAPTPAPSKAQRHWYQVGKASWYGPHFQGKTTANGERFDMNAFTCAHRTLPLGSWIRVTNLRNHRSAFVRVNDRGPVPTSRILDLSYAAASRLALGGLSDVRIERVTGSDPAMTRQLIAQLEKPSLLSQSR
ncbi:MAG TPA: septal ring lytic transglycosylase RlpA family protein [Acidobacteriaceae bacterium]|jgi:rare lipoprotein A|nr:septal ring lytic transglycosylase RlpA family protein [Acidobacteriaceae bacterium]